MLGTGGHYGAAGRKAAGMYESLRDLRGPAGFFVVSSYRQAHDSFMGCSACLK